ncbi:uncharacterized protein N7482_005082 [Penicillium canariense]|uniref:Uncharacterized protein n=1 Tax=Penicillium canariense TaxID=189055 RepID=A0A9W9LMN7_9EURO|nr:uncharacterized protein N7482_005082 [Penicillium canariense]KAJ5166301.1 hypothetical protein N7482_005082 [Penicillium canariense]
MPVADVHGSEQKWRAFQGWLPQSLHKTYLVTLAGLFLFMLTVIESLRQCSKRQGGIIHWQYEEDLPTAIWGAYTYLPLIFALLAINLLDVCAQDVLRLEPFFQLAKPDGAPATVLFINYCCNGLTASVTAFRNRHWVVLCVAPVSLIFRLFLPSLLAGLVVLDDGNWVQKKIVNTWPSIIDLEIQQSWLSAGSSSQGPLGSAELNSFFMPDPSDYATPPISMPLDDQNDSSLLTLNQTIYWSNMTCVTSSRRGSSPDAVVHLNSTSPLPNGEQIWSWDVRNVTMGGIPGENSSSQCQVTVQLDTVIASDQGTIQARFWEPMGSDEKLLTPSAFSYDGCSLFKIFGVIVDMQLAAGNVSDSNVTVLACSPTYQQAWADVTLNPNASIANVKTASSTVKPLDTLEFYVEGIHDLIASRYLLSEHNVRLGNDLQFNFSAGDNDPVILTSDSTIINSQQYLEEIRRYWNSQFVVTIDRFFSPGAAPTPADAEQQSLVIILTVASKAVSLAEAILILGLILLGGLTYVYQHRPNFLHWDPGSIAAQCAIVAKLFTPASRAIFAEAKLHQATTRQLRQWANGKWCEWVDEDGEQQLQIADWSEVSSAPPHPPPGRRDPMPHFLRPLWFLMECLILAGTLAFFGVSLAYLRWKNINSFFSTGALVSMIFLNYGPTAIASIIGSFLASIYRNLSLMEPWIWLQEGMATARQSVVENYGIQTPFVPLFMQRHHRPGLLFTVSLVCLGDLALRILSGGLFTPQLKTSTSATSAVVNIYNSSAIANRVDDTDIEMSLMATSRVMNNVSFLRWTSTDGQYFLMPFAIHEPSDDDYTTYSAITRGIGADLECQVLGPNPSVNDSVSGALAWNYTIAGDENGHTCTVNIPLTEGLAAKAGRSVHFYAPNGTDTFCANSSIFVLAFSELKNMSSIKASSSVALHCQQKIHLQDFHVEFDSSGMIQDQKLIDGSIITSGGLFHNASEILGSFNQMLTSSPRNFSSHHSARPHSQHHRNRHHRYDWPGRLTANAYDTLYSKDSEMTPEHLILAVQTVYQTVFSTHLALWKETFLYHLPPHSAQPAYAKVIDSLWGFIPSTSLVVAIISLLAVDAIALMGVFIVRFNRYRGPRIPRSIGSLMPWIVQSRMMTDCGDTYDMSERERERYLIERDRRYRVGDFSTAGGQQWALDYDDRHGTLDIELHESRTTE